MHVLAVGQRAGHQRAVEVVEGGERLGRVLDEAEVALAVVADRELVVAGLEEAVHRAAVELVAPALPRVVGVGVAAALPVGRQAVGRVRVALEVGVGQARLAAVGVGHPAEVVVEGPVLHHQHDERVDRQVARRREVLAPLPLGRLGDERLGRQHARQADGAGGHRRALQELAAAHGLVGRRLLETLELGRIELVHGPEATGPRPEGVAVLCEGSGHGPRTERARGARHRRVAGHRPGDRRRARRRGRARGDQLALARPDRSRGGGDRRAGLHVGHDRPRRRAAPAARRGGRARPDRRAGLQHRRAARRPRPAGVRPRAVGGGLPHARARPDRAGRARGRRHAPARLGPGAQRGLDHGPRALADPDAVEHAPRRAARRVQDDRAQRRRRGRDAQHRAARPDRHRPAVQPVGVAGERGGRRRRAGAGGSAGDGRGDGGRRGLPLLGPAPATSPARRWRSTAACCSRSEWPRPRSPTPGTRARPSGSRGSRRRSPARPAGR